MYTLLSFCCVRTTIVLYFIDGKFENDIFIVGGGGDSGPIDSTPLCVVQKIASA